MKNRFKFYKEKAGIGLYIDVGRSFYYYENKGEIKIPLTEEILKVLLTSKSF